MRVHAPAHTQTFEGNTTKYPNIDLAVLTSFLLFSIMNIYYINNSKKN